MQVFVKVMGGAMRVVIGTSPVESACAASNIFLGQVVSSSCNNKDFVHLFWSLGIN
jgi:nucleoside permease NupC